MAKDVKILKRPLKFMGGGNTVETIWLIQQHMVDLFQTSRTNVVKHIKHVYDEGEFNLS